MKIFLAILLAFNTSVASECNEPVSLLNKGDKAPCTGFLFSPEQEKIAATAYDDAAYYKLLSEKLESRLALSNKQIDIFERRIDLYIQQTDLLAKQVVEKESDDFWRKTLYFGLGVLATGIAFYGASKLNP